MGRHVAWLVLVLTGCLADKLLLWPPKAAPASHAQRQVLHGPDGSIEVFVESSNPGTEPAAAQVPDQLDSLRNAARARAPAIFVSSREDGVVPFGYHPPLL